MRRARNVMGRLRLGGRIKAGGGEGLAGVAVRLEGSSAASVRGTGAGGDYLFEDLGGGGYKITPTKAGYAFNPPDRFVILRTSDYDAADFIAAPAGL